MGAFIGAVKGKEYEDKKFKITSPRVSAGSFDLLMNTNMQSSPYDTEAAAAI